MTKIDSKIFNTKKSDYVNTPLFLGQDNGLLDTVNKRYPQLEVLYKKLKSQDWDETEFDFTSCNTDFKTCTKSVYDMMIRTIAWQWTADTVAARSLIPIVAPFVSSTELWSLWLRIGDNEQIHGLTYSEMVRNSFDNPDDVLAEILSVTESLARMNSIAEVFSNTRSVGLRIQTNQLDKNTDEAYDAIFMFVVALFCLERIQFMSSFAVTFAIANTGMFLPFGKAVQKICADENEIHVVADKAILDIELNTERGLMAFNRNRSAIERLVNEIILTEFTWVDYLFSEGRELTGVTPDTLKGWVMNCAKDVLKFFAIKSNLPFQDVSPLGYMKDWINLDKIQASPQEEKHGAYLVGMVIPDDDSSEFDISNL